MGILGLKKVTSRLSKMGRYKSYLAMSKMRGGRGVEATFGQCPKQRRFFFWVCSLSVKWVVSSVHPCQARSDKMLGWLHGIQATLTVDKVNRNRRYLLMIQKIPLSTPFGNWHPDMINFILKIIKMSPLQHYCAQIV